MHSHSWEFRPRPWYWWFWPWWCWRWHGSCWDCGFSSESYDHHPSPCWADLFATAPDLPALWAAKNPGIENRFRPEFGPVFYRGRLNGSARLLVVGQDPSSDEQLAHRAFVGNAGQRLQRFLHKAGMTRSYVMVNTFHYGVKGQYADPPGSLSAFSADPDVSTFRNQLMDTIKARSHLTAILTVGSAARDAVDHWPGRAGLTRIHIVHPSAPESIVLPNWNLRLPNLIAAVTPDGPTDTTPYGATFTPADAADIPRRDLPFGVPAWHGTTQGQPGKTHSQRLSDTEIKWTSP